MRNVFKILLTTVICALATLRSSAITPVKDLVSYDDFQDLLIFNIARIPEMKPVWELGMKNGNLLKLNGGKIRGFLHWHSLKLQTFSVDQIKKLPPPSLRDCEVAGGYDLDLIGPEYLRNEVRSIFGNSENVDYINSEASDELLQMGGPTIEKVSINPAGIDDPLKGLKSYYDGQLVFHSVPESRFRSLERVKSRDYSKTAEALRFIRFLYNLPELTPEPSSVDEIRKISDVEVPYLMNRSDKKEFIFTAMLKLLDTRDFDMNAVLLDLQKYHILKTLSKLDIYYSSNHNLADYIRSKRVNLDDFTIENLFYIEELLGRPQARNYLDFLNILAPRIKTTADLEELNEFSLSAYHEVFVDWKIANQHTLKNLETLFPEVRTANQCKALFK